MSKNVMIPLFLLDRIIELLDDLEPPEYHESRYDYCDILWALRVKKQKIELRGTYANIISAADQAERNKAKSEYLRQNSKLADLIEDDIPF